MSQLSFLLDLQSLGVHLRPTSAGKLVVRYPSGGLSSAQREALRRRRALLLGLLEARETAYAEWVAALNEISALWNRTKDCRGDAPFLSEEKDHRLTGEVAQAIKACDLPRARRAIRAWRGAWLRLLRPAGGTVDPDRAVAETTEPRRGRETP